MKTVTKAISGFALTVFIVLIGAYNAMAQNSFTMKSAVASVQGTSSLHDWESQVTQVECTGSFQSNSTTLQSMKNVQVKMVEL